jgi:hypothetical protein
MAKSLRFGYPVWRYSARARVEGRLVAEAEISAVFVE